MFSTDRIENSGNYHCHFAPRTYITFAIELTICRIFPIAIQFPAIMVRILWVFVVSLECLYRRYFLKPLDVTTFIRRMPKAELHVHLESITQPVPTATGASSPAVGACQAQNCANRKYRPQPTPPIFYCQPRQPCHPYSTTTWKLDSRVAATDQFAGHVPHNRTACGSVRQGGPPSRIGRVRSPRCFPNGNLT